MNLPNGDILDCKQTECFAKYANDAEGSDTGFKNNCIIRGLRLHSDKDKVNIFDLVDVFSSNDLSNALYRHFQEREKFYINRIEFLL